MEFITKEQFLEQPKGIQKVILGWWELSIGDLVDYKYYLPRVACIEDKDTLNFLNYHKKDCIPLLTEGQLRKFIEDNIQDKMTDLKYCINPENFLSMPQYKIEGVNSNEQNLLQAYWKVALEIAKGSVINNKDQEREGRI